MITLFHYTAPVSSHLLEILRTRRIQKTESNIRPDGTGTPVVWLTTSKFPSHQAWATSVTEKQQARFEIELPEDEVISWPQFASDEQMDPMWYDMLNKAGEYEGKTKDEHLKWYVLPRTIGWKEIARLDVFLPDKEPLTFTDEALKQLFFSNAARKNLALRKTKKVRVG